MFGSCDANHPFNLFIGATPIELNGNVVSRHRYKKYRNHPGQNSEERRGSAIKPAKCDINRAVFLMPK